MILSDRDLWAMQRAERVVTPWNVHNLQPASIDLTLGNEFIANGAKFAVTGGYSLAPREFVLGTTNETITVPTNLVGEVKGRSTWARRGLIVENAGWIDPGFNGMVTLELYNIGNDTLYLPIMDRICQISFTRMTSHAMAPYGTDGLGSHYQDQRGVQGPAKD
jgi:dCTP deaminase